MHSCSYKLLNEYLCVCIGVADGVGGWRDYGVDPSQFSGTLMKTCERLVKEGRFVPSNPVGVLTTSYYELLQNKVPLLGEYSCSKHRFSDQNPSVTPVSLNPETSQTSVDITWEMREAARA